MKIKSLIAVAVAAVAGGAAFTTAAADAADRAPTKVTIQAESGGFFGYVKSDDPATCAEDRKVVVYEMLGSTPSPSTDTKVATDNASLNGTKYQWSIGNPGLREGFFYAKAVRTAECKADLSRVLEAQE
jgi:hypothetical protein